MGTLAAAGGGPSLGRVEGLSRGWVENSSRGGRGILAGADQDSRRGGSRPLTGAGGGVLAGAGRDLTGAGGGVLVGAGRGPSGAGGELLAGPEGLQPQRVRRGAAQPLQEEELLEHVPDPVVRVPQRLHPAEQERQLLDVGLLRIRSYAESRAPQEGQAPGAVPGREWQTPHRVPQGALERERLVGVHGPRAVQVVAPTRHMSPS